jgi:hypothetical protein
MSEALANGVLSVVQAAVGPVIAEVKALRTELAAVKSAPRVGGGSVGEDLDAVADMVEAATAPLHERIKALEQRPPAPRYLGVWRSGNEYTPGDLVTDKGSLWLACRPSSARPGTPDSGFTLIVKAGGYGSREDVPS